MPRSSSAELGARCGWCDRDFGPIDGAALADTLREHRRRCAMPLEWDGLLPERPLLYYRLAPVDD